MFLTISACPALSPSDRLSASGTQPQEQRRMKGTGMRMEATFSPLSIRRALSTATFENSS